MIYIVIPVHNRKDTTLECLEHLAKQTYQDYRVVIVDDGSTDGTAAPMVANSSPSVNALARGLDLSV